MPYAKRIYSVPPGASVQEVRLTILEIVLINDDEPHLRYG